MAWKGWNKCKSIHTWKVLQGLVPNPGLNEASENEYLGRRCHLPKITHGRQAIQSLKEQCCVGLICSIHCQNILETWRNALRRSSKWSWTTIFTHYQINRPLMCWPPGDRTWRAIQLHPTPGGQGASCEGPWEVLRRSIGNSTLILSYSDGKVRAKVDDYLNTK